VGDEKYAMHGPNEILRETKLRSGHNVWEFIRSNPYWGGVGKGATSEGLSDVLEEKMLDKLVDRGGTCILYTHLGKIRSRKELFPEKTRNALIALKNHFYSEGKILVTTTCRLLNYCILAQGIKMSVSYGNQSRSTDISVSVPGTGNTQSNIDCSGLTFYVPGNCEVNMKINEKSISGLQYNGPDETGKGSVSIPWRRLDFPAI